MMSDTIVNASSRDDRTRLALTHLLGAERAALALTHFAAQTVLVVVSSTSLEPPNGWAATWLVVNMLTRFVGVVELRVAGHVGPVLQERINRELERMQQIDTRKARLVTWTTDTGAASGLAEIWIGDLGSRNASTEHVVALGFDAWSCRIRRQTSLQETVMVVPSAIPFGALAGACFAVAEIFKTLIAAAVDSSERASAIRRHTHAWDFSVWSADRIRREMPKSDRADAPAFSGSDVFTELVLNGVLQVGAGAVGNAVAYAFHNACGIRGALDVFDTKLVDYRNLNRCLFFRELHVGARKVAVVEAEASRPGLHVLGRHEPYRPDYAQGASIIVSTVDNNNARHLMQETLPPYLIQGSTSDTRISVSVHTPLNGRSCLVCRHPDRSTGGDSPRPLTVKEASDLTGLPEDVVAEGRHRGSMEITLELIESVEQRSPIVAAALQQAKEQGRDLCGALGELRQRFGIREGPAEASVPFVSALAGILAAAEVVKVLLRSRGMANVPVLDNVLEIDLVRDYSRLERVSFAEPPRDDCQLCKARAADIEALHLEAAS